jgi:Holliday junction resolvase RusA-like endonuclease
MRCGTRIGSIMEVIRFIVAGKPMGKGRVRFVGRTGHAFTPGRTVTYEAQLATAAQAAMDGRPPVGGPVAVTLEIWMPIASSWPLKKQIGAELGFLRPTGKPDIDNVVKMLDALNHIIWDDDSQIVMLSAFKRYSVTPQLVVEITDLTLTDPPL